MTGRLFVDFDNTITADDVAYWEGEQPNPDREMIEAVNQWYFDGGTVIIHTARPWSEAGRIAGHCAAWGLRHHAIKCNKGSGDIYVDDKSVSPAEFLGEDNTFRDSSR